MRTRITLLAIVAAAVFFAVSLVVFSVYTVNAISTSTATLDQSSQSSPGSATLDQSSQLTKGAASSSTTVSDISSNPADSAGEGVHYIGSACEGYHSTSTAGATDDVGY